MKNRFKAISTVEILLALFLSSFLVLVSANLYSAFYLNSIKQKELLFLQKESFHFISYLQKHIQHLGYQGINRKKSNFLLFEKEGKRYAISNHNQCLLFFYDLNSDGCLGKRHTKNASCITQYGNNTKEIIKEVFGVKVENQELYIYDKNKFEECANSECYKLLENCSEKWRKFSNKEEYIVDNLTFKWEMEGKLLNVCLRLRSSHHHRITYEVESKIHILN